jgi:hypothetical protein
MSPCAAWARLCGLGSAAAIAALVALGCSGESTSEGYASPGYAGGAGSSGGSGGGTGTKPMLVLVDTDRVMNATPGDGVGVFTEYRSGGHWRIWWTCDTNKTSQSCSFAVSAATGGALSNAAGISLATGDTVQQSNGTEVSASTTTTTSVQGMTFDTAPGATITLDAQMDGQETGEILFFVQDGKINGGYMGTLTDPLMLQPSTP